MINWQLLEVVRISLLTFSYLSDNLHNLLELFTSFPAISQILFFQLISNTKNLMYHGEKKMAPVLSGVCILAFVCIPVKSLG